MTARRTKSNITKAVATVDDPFEPIDLDPPSPALARWEALNHDAEIYHDGDASKVIPVPRPVWSDPDQDVVGDRANTTSYRSSVARVISSAERGVDLDDSLDQARVCVQVKMSAAVDCIRYAVQLTLSRANGPDRDKPWTNSTMTLTISEVEELIDVLSAAVELTGGEK